MSESWIRVSRDGITEDKRNTWIQYHSKFKEVVIILLVWCTEQVMKPCRPTLQLFQQTKNKKRWYYNYKSCWSLTCNHFLVQIKLLERWHSTCTLAVSGDINLWHHKMSNLGIWHKHVRRWEMDRPRWCFILLYCEEKVMYAWSRLSKEAKANACLCKVFASLHSFPSNLVFTTSPILTYYNLVMVSHVHHMWWLPPPPLLSLSFSPVLFRHFGLLSSRVLCTWYDLTKVEFRKRKDQHICPSHIISQVYIFTTYIYYVDGGLIFEKK